MNFLSPWFLVGALLVAGPIVAHLIRRATRDRVAFSATRFLDESRPQLQRRSRLQHPWLLLLRCLIVALLAAAFARPFFSSGSPTPALVASPLDLVLVLDDSASMRRSGVWAEAKARALRRIEALRPVDRCTLFLVSSPTPLISAVEWLQRAPEERVNAVRTLLKDRAPGWCGTPLDAAVDSALEAFFETPAGATQRRLVLLSDFAVGSRLSGLAGRDWPAALEVQLDRIPTPLTSNAGVQWLGWSEGATPGEPQQARIRVTRDSGSLRLPLRLSVFDALSGQAIGPEQTIELAPGETRVAPVSIEGTLTTPLRVELTGDSEPFDNRTWVMPSAPRTIRLVYLGSGDEADPARPLFYLRRALGHLPGLAVELQSLAPTAADAPMADAALYVVAEPLTAPRAQALRSRLERGAHALVLVSSPEIASSLTALTGEPWQAAVPDSSDALFGFIDFAHPLFSLFADPRYSDFTHVRFWRPTSLLLPDTTRAAVTARFDDDRPAVVELAVGEGRLIAWAGDWSPAASQWVLSTKFVPWVQALLERASGGPAPPASAEVGNAESLLGARRASAAWRASDAPDDAYSSTVPTTPGAYQLRNDSGLRWVALQVPAEESRTDPLPLDAFEQLGVPLEPTRAASLPSARPSIDTTALQTEGRQKLWRWLLLAVAALLALESLAAIVIARRETATGATVPAP